MCPHQEQKCNPSSGNEMPFLTTALPEAMFQQFTSLALK